MFKAFLSKSLYPVCVEFSRRYILHTQVCDRDPAGGAAGQQVRDRTTGHSSGEQGVHSTGHAGDVNPVLVGERSCGGTSTSCRRLRVLDNVPLLTEGVTLCETCGRLPRVSQARLGERKFHAR
ncbi:hypothetical protein PGT21_005037 [Puccinia graminis f. sp. tritici]|uniref:Uncharacterized protein n=1 Tax=Puccinia graminis f. sp. tritici TaxID=56615 RepID=A0A5B0PR46_PUCGR|nr:hypothetical protein PGTUg99_012646 [Puccinia graminis f. sp. tritici]KAA1065590.1 hypothetical protein PGT21_004273 [Puccinia graminis f. sp. tritici]KAA1080004.1 hypothetical protein PGTUg99_020570 [Puccinia graminis f. sp. tritici]KAA1103048.1 hypothetical protein PGT21_005037 [Puccinia graminis f. sp. tritici]